MTAEIAVTAWRWATAHEHGLLIAEGLRDAASGVPGRHVLVHGDARGGDRVARDIALSWGWDHIPLEARWTDPCRAECEPGHRKRRSAGDGTYCPAQGNFRNQRIVDRRPRVLVAFPGPDSRGTLDCVRRAQRAGIRVIRVDLAWPDAVPLHGCAGCGMDIPARMVVCHRCWSRLPVPLQERYTAALNACETHPKPFADARHQVRDWFTTSREADRG